MIAIGSNRAHSHFREKQPGKFVGDTECTKLPIELCGTNECKAEEGEEECHNKGGNGFTAWILCLDKAGAALNVCWRVGWLVGKTGEQRSMFCLQVSSRWSVV